MTEQIMKILPAKKKCPVMFADTREFRNGKEHGFDEGVEACAAAIEKANLVRCPTEEEIEIVMHNAYFKHKELIKSTDAGMLKEYAKAIFALLRGDK